MKRWLDCLVLSWIMMVIVLLFISLPCNAASTDILIEKSGTVMSWTDAHLDNNFVATYVSTNSPPAIRVYFMNGTLYKSVPLSNDNVDLDSLEFSDGRIYFTEHNRDDFAYRQNETVYQYTLATGERKVLYTSSWSGERVTKIAASGDHVVLKDGDDDKVILYTLSTGERRLIFTSPNSIYSLEIDGNRILWGCERVDREPGREIHVYSISTGTDYIIPESKSAKTFGYGDISGDNVVWVMSAKDPGSINSVPALGESYDMKLTDLVSGRTQSVERSDISPITTPFISGDTVAWVKKPNVDYNNSDTGIIRTYNITTGTVSDFATNVNALSDFRDGVVLWSRLQPVSFWVTPLSGKIPEVAISPFSQTASQSPTTIQKTTTSQKSPVDPGLIIAVLAVGATGYTILKKKRWQ